MLRILKKMFPQASIALSYRTHFELLVAVILSAQCTDKKVNEVTARLFKKYRTLKQYAHANRNEFEKDITSTGFYRNKTKNVLKAAKMVYKEFKGTLPKTMKEMVRIPGVGRKTANVVLGNAYGIVEGITVDTHVRRLAIKFDLTDHTDPNKIEHDLMNSIPKQDWFRSTYLLIEYGRRVCPARHHECSNHPLSKIYPPAARRFPKAR